MSTNDHAQDRYDPPSIGSDWEESFFSELNRGDVFRVLQSAASKQYRKVDEGTAFDVKEQIEIKLEPQEKVYVKS
tara:strand:- start:1246 stop:1470 length:225 start_codon:yes stop_codon:yes gene_type:complete